MQRVEEALTFLPSRIWLNHIDFTTPCPQSISQRRGQQPRRKEDVLPPKINNKHRSSYNPQDGQNLLQRRSEREAEERDFLEKQVAAQVKEIKESREKLSRDKKVKELEKLLKADKLKVSSTLRWWWSGLEVMGMLYQVLKA